MFYRKWKKISNLLQDNETHNNQGIQRALQSRTMRYKQLPRPKKKCPIWQKTDLTIRTETGWWFLLDSNPIQLLSVSIVMASTVTKINSHIIWAGENKWKTESVVKEICSIGNNVHQSTYLWGLTWLTNPKENVT